MLRYRKASQFPHGSTRMKWLILLKNHTPEPPVICSCANAAASSIWVVVGGAPAAAAAAMAWWWCSGISCVPPMSAGLSMPAMAAGLMRPRCAESEFSHEGCVPAAMRSAGLLRAARVAACCSAEMF